MIGLLLKPNTCTLFISKVVSFVYQEIQLKGALLSGLIKGTSCLQKQKYIKLDLDLHKTRH